jgi:hypothetical protein
MFRGEEEQRVVDEHLDDLTLDQVTRTFADDLAQRAVPAPIPGDPLDDASWVEALATTYAERAPRIA